MFEPISAVGPQYEFGAIYSLARAGSAISTEAQTVQRVASVVLNSVERSQALFGSKAVAISQLHALAHECADPDWDGHGALPLTQLAVFKTVAFIRALPASVPLPEFAPEPDGSISLDWIQSRHRLFSVSVGFTDRLAFAWLDGTDKGHGVARFDGERIPPKILQGIRGIMNRGDAAVWIGEGC